MKDKLKKKFIVCLTGMPGAGKSTVAKALAEDEFILFNMGDCVRMESKKRSLEPTDDNLGRLMLTLRKDLGSGAIAFLIIDQIKEKYSDDTYSKFVIDGIRSVSEIDVLKTIGTVKILAIHGSISTRFSHLKIRARSDAPSTVDDCLVRDKRELSVGVSEAIALADEVISNNYISIEQLRKQAKTIAKNWLSQWTNMKDDV